MEKIKITPEERRRVSIKNANDRPNARATYGEADMDSTGTKNMFDRPFELAADKHNALCDRVAEDEAKEEQSFADMNDRLDEDEKTLSEHGQALDEHAKDIGELARRMGEGTDTVDEKISAAVEALVGGAPGALDTLVELSAALGDDKNFAATVANKFAEIANKSKETDQVLSEHGEALVKIDRRSTEQQAQIWQISDKSNDTDSRMSRAEKRIENLESGISPDPFVTDGSSAYERSVPEGACPYAELSRIGGSSCGSDGLLKLTDSPVTAVRSVSVTDGENGESVETVLHELTVPEEIRALEGYGHGVNTEYCSYIDWRPEENIKKFVRRTRRITFKGTENWAIQSESFQTETSMMFSTTCAIDKFMGEKRPAASTLFKWNSVGNVQQSFGENKVNAFNFHPNPNDSHYIYVRISRDKLETQDEAGFKKYLADNYAAGTPFVVEYAISTPEETDLSDILDDDNLIPVSVGGRIVALNAESRDVPLEVTYQIKEAEE